LEPDPGSTGEGKKSFFNQPSSIKPLLLVAESIAMKKLQMVLTAFFKSMRLSADYCLTIKRIV